MVSTNPISLPSETTRTNASRANPPSGGFGATMAAEVDATSTLERAEDLIGTRIRAPEGGCGCDALVGTVMQSPTPAPDRAITSAPATPIQTPMPAATMPQTWDVSPGRILVFNDPSDLSDRLHQAILRNATEMIAANRDGLVEVRSIPWGQVR